MTYVDKLEGKLNEILVKHLTVSEAETAGYIRNHLFYIIALGTPSKRQSVPNLTIP